ncbi:retrovirus-related pol polyprotein from transposon TNT 1-94 [Tanacetum coccineum]
MDTIKFLKHSIEKGPYQMKPILAIDTAVARLQTEDDLTGDDLKPYEADFEALNLILISIPNDIYNSLDACENARDKEKRVTKTHDPLALVANTYASSSSSRSPAAYYVTHPPSVVYYHDDYQRDAVFDDQEDSLTIEMMLLTRAITQCYSTPINNRFCTSSNTRNQAIVQADRVDIQRRYVGNDGRYARRSSSTQCESAKSGNCYNCNAKGHYTRGCPKPRFRDFKYFIEQMFLAKKDEAEIILTNEQNNFLLADAFEIKELKDLSTNICMMARIQQAENDPEDRPIYDSSFISVLQNPSTSFMNPLFSQSDYEQRYYEQHEIINPIIGDDQINSDIIFDDPNIEVSDEKLNTIKMLMINKIMQWNY